MRSAAGDDRGLADLLAQLRRLRGLAIAGLTVLTRLGRLGRLAEGRLRGGRARRGLSLVTER